MSSFVPAHLKKYTVAQNYRKYTPEDQAVWRYIMKGINKNMSQHGLKGGLEGIRKTGIRQDKIPKISDIDRKLQKFGWRAACISGFIPPRAFMEFQRNRILPIASEIRSIQHIFYTPAPDIVHEAVGHIPFLTNPLFSKFLAEYAKTVLKAVSSREDRDKYEAIRDLSDLKENPKSTLQQVKKQERKLAGIIKNISHTSEASYLSRFIWWTSEYGLMGSLKNPKIYGAGLVSSVGEALHIKKVKKIRLSAKCLDYPFDITDFQPQLFTAESFEHLLETLKEIAGRLAFNRGGLYGIEQALKSKVLNTVELDSGLQISGVLEKAMRSKNKPVFLKFSGPVQLCFKGRELKGHGKSRHKEGYSSPLKIISKNKKPVHLWKDGDLKKQGLAIGKKTLIQFEGGIKLEGFLESALREKGRLLVLTFKKCLITGKSGEALYRPSWGPFDLAIGSEAVSVFSGPADNKAYRLKDNFEPSKVPQRVFTEKQKHNFKIYTKINSFKNKKLSGKVFKEILQESKKHKNAWLLFLELLDFARRRPKLKKQILAESAHCGRLVLQKQKVFSLGRRFYEV